MQSETHLEVVDEKPMSGSYTTNKTEILLNKMENDYAELEKQINVSKKQTNELEKKALTLLQKLMPIQNAYLINIITTLQNNTVVTKSPFKENNLVDNTYEPPVVLLEPDQ